MLLDAKYEEAAANLNGKRSTGTPRVQAALAATYNVAALPGLSLNGGLKYIGAAYLDTANTYRLSPYTTVDAGASYSTRLVGKDVTFTAAIQNLAGHRYWIYNGGNYIASGAPRTVSLNARMASWLRACCWPSLAATCWRRRSRSPCRRCCPCRGSRPS
jgi:iron complex outermembrane receptor protein